MRITCDISVGNRLLPSFNMKQKNKALKSQLSIGKKPGSSNDIFLMVCSKNDRNGNKFKLKGNILKCFTKFVNEGKATISFTEPPNDLIISKADPIQLKGFLSLVKMGFEGKEMENTTLSVLAPASAKQMDNLKTKLTITTRRDYPITTGFPHTLEQLSVVGCNLKKFDSRMLTLRNLTVLDLSDNSLKTLPGDFNRVPNLSELRLSGNQLEDIPECFCTSSLSLSLYLLDISNNKLKVLRPYFCKLTNLGQLKLDKNELQCLPQAFGTMPRLKHLSIMHNKLKTLPPSFAQLRLESLDLFENDFMEVTANSSKNRLTFPTLLECAAKAIKTQRIPYTEDDVGHLMDYLNSAKVCLCGKYCFRSYVHYLFSMDLHRVSGTIAGIDSLGSTLAPCEAFLCSQYCYNRYQKNPNASIWR